VLKPGSYFYCLTLLEHSLKQGCQSCYVGLSRERVPRVIHCSISGRVMYPQFRKCSGHSHSNSTSPIGEVLVQNCHDVSQPHSFDMRKGAALLCLHCSVGYVCFVCSLHPVQFALIVIWRLLLSGMWQQVARWIFTITRATCCLHRQGTGRNGQKVGQKLASNA
jgi:hypothetical protein